jgi:hypothetical protein
MTEAGVACWVHGELLTARGLLERAIRDLARFLGRGHELRLRSLTALRDLLVYQDELSRASAVQREIVECETERLGADHPSVHDARNALAEIMLKAVDHVGVREV